MSRHASCICGRDSRYGDGCCEWCGCDLDVYAEEEIPSVDAMERRYDKEIDR